MARSKKNYRPEYLPMEGLSPEEQQPNQFKGVVHNKLQQILVKKVICMAVDGLVKKEQGKEGVIPKDKRDCLTKILLSVDRNSSDITYYEPELNVIHLGYLFVTQIISLLQRHLHCGHI